MYLGLNVVSDSVMNYGWYSSRMVKVINHIQLCFPEADRLMHVGCDSWAENVELLIPCDVIVLK